MHYLYENGVYGVVRADNGCKVLHTPTSTELAYMRLKREAVCVCDLLAGRYPRLSDLHTEEDTRRFLQDVNRAGAVAEANGAPGITW